MFGLRIWSAAAIALRLALPVAVLIVGWIALEQWARHERLSDQRTFDARTFDLAARAMVPGSALACLDALAGEAVEAACEKALFASPETVAAAVSYVAAKLALLAAGRSQEAAGSRSPALVQMRRATESDRFGIVAHVLAARDGCTSAQCAAFVLFDDASRVSANIAAQTFDTTVQRHAASWPAAAETGHPVAGATPQAPPAPGTAPVASARTPNNLFFPSASSIPPVSIMNAEPGGGQQDTTGSADGKPARKPAQAARPSGNANTAGSAAPMPIAPAPQ